MWGTVLFIAFIAALDPIRVGIALLLISWPRPLHNLLAYWLGAMAASFASALAALILLRKLTPILTERIEAISGSPFVHYLQIGVGLVALPLAALTVALSVRRTRMAISNGSPSVMPMKPPAIPAGLQWLQARTQNGLQPRSVGFVFIGGFLSATPPVEYLVILTAILASGAAIGIQLSAAMAFTLVSLVVIEIPLLTCLAAPARSQAVMAHVQNWVHARRQMIVAVGLAVGGLMMLATGLGAT